MLCILSVTWPMMIQTRTSIIHLLLYTLQFIFLSSHASLHSTLSARSLSSLCRIFAVSVACPCSQSARATTASSAPRPGRVVVGRRSHSSDHHRVSALGYPSGRADPLDSSASLATGIVSAESTQLEYHTHHTIPNIHYSASLRQPPHGCRLQVLH